MPQTSDISHESDQMLPGAALLDCALVTLLGVLVTAYYSWVALRIDARMGTGMDLAIFDQAVRTLAAGGWPTSSMKAVGMNLWGDHFHPVIVLAVPAYWLWPDPRSLLVVQAAALGLTCSIVSRTALRLMPGRRLTALAVGLALACAPGVQSGMTFDFHEVALGMPLLAMALAAFLESDQRRCLLWALALLAVKEDAGLFSFGLGVACLVRGWRRTGAVLVALAVLWTAVAVKVVIPHFSPTGDWLYANRVNRLDDAVDSIRASATVRGGLVDSITRMVLGFAALPVASPVLIVLAPTLLMRASSGNPAYWGIGHHYNLLPSVVLAAACLDVVRRLRHVHRWSAVLIALGAGALVNGQAWDEATRPVDAGRLSEARAALAMVPSGESVAADVHLTPQLTAAHPVTQKLLPPHYTDDLGRPITTRWVIVDRASPSYGGADTWSDQAIEHFTAQGLEVKGQRGDFVVLGPK